MLQRDTIRDLNYAVLKEYYASGEAIYGTCLDCGEQTKIINQIVNHACQNSL